MNNNVDIKKQYYLTLYEKLIRDCRKDPNQFIQYVLSWGIPNWLPFGEIHKRWQDTLTNGGKRVLLLAPRDHAKTTCIPIGRCLWELGNNPNLRIKIVCQSEEIAIKRLQAITEIIEYNPRFKEVFPHIVPADKGTWTKTKICVKRDIISPDPSIEAVGILSTATGGRADLLIFDDPVDFRNAIEQPALRNTVKEVYRNVWVNLLEPEGRLWIIGTTWHKDDLLNYLKNDTSYTVVIDAINDNCDPLWEAKWSKEALLERKSEIKSRAFARSFQMKAISDDEVLFTEELLYRCVRDDFRYGELPEEYKNNNDVLYFAGIDLGSARITKTANYTVIFVGAFVDNKKIPISIIRGRMKSPEFAKIFYDTVKQFSLSLILIENNASQEAIIQWLNESYSDILLPPIKGYFTGSQKMSESVGIPSMVVEFEQGSWLLPALHNDNCSCGYCIWLKELKEFPIGETSDTVMASWFFREAIRLYKHKVPRITILSDKDVADVDNSNIEKFSDTFNINRIIRELEGDEDD